MPLGISCFNPYSNNFYKEHLELKKLPIIKQTLVWALTIIASALTFGLAGDYVFRYLVGRITAQHPKNQKRKLTESVVRVSGKVLLKEESKALRAVKLENSDKTDALASPKADKPLAPKLSQSFEKVCDYISKKYPKFPIREFHSIEEFQAKGHPYHFAAINRDIQLIYLLKEAGADANQLDDDGKNFFMVMMEHAKFGEKKFVEDKMLICHLGVDIFQEDKSGMSAIEVIAVRNLYSGKELANILNAALTFQKNIADVADTVLQILDIIKNPDAFECALKFGISIDFNKVDETGRTYLYKAINENDFVSAMYFLEKSTNPNLGKSKVDDLLKCAQLIETKMVEIKNLKDKGPELYLGWDLELELKQWNKLKSLIELKLNTI